MKENIEVAISGRSTSCIKRRVRYIDYKLPRTIVENFTERYFDTVEKEVNGRNYI